MGMYDYINSEQVKCFPVPFYYKSFSDDECGITLSGGRLRNFKNGEEVPYKSFYRKYSKNFMVLDESPEYAKEDAVLKICIHVIKDGKVYGSYYSLEELKNLFDDNELFIDIRGRVININSTNDIIDFINEKKIFNEQRIVYFKKSDEYYKHFMNAWSGLGALDENSEEYKEKTEKSDKYSILMEEQRKIDSENFQTISIPYLKKWYSEDSRYILEETFGEYLEILLSYEIYKNEKEEDINTKTMILKEFHNFIIENENIVEKYLNWLDESIRESTKELIQIFIK